MIMVIILIILALVIAMGIAMVLVSKKRAKEGKTAKMGYRGVYIFGIIIVPFSILTMAVMIVLQTPFYVGLPLFALGLTYLIVGWLNKDKWTK